MQEDADAIRLHILHVYPIFTSTGTFFFRQNKLELSFFNILWWTLSKGKAVNLVIFETDEGDVRLPTSSS